jgi:hypothetical protein
MELEQRVAALEAALEKANLEILRAQAAVEIQSVMGRYEFYYSAQRQDLIRGLWSKNAPDAAMDIQGGANLVNCPRSPEDLERQQKMMAEQTVGLFRIHTLCTPVVEVAKDGQTARACWFSPGIDTDPTVDPETGARKGVSKWCWIKYGVDFVREDGEWKLWHVSAYGSFHCDFYQSWADQPEKPISRSMIPNDPSKPPPPSGGPGFVPAERHDWTYSINRLPELEPAPPEPYQTWSDLGYPGYRTFDDEEAKKYITWV